MSNPVANKEDAFEFTPLVFYTNLTIIFFILFNFAVTSVAAVYIAWDLGASESIISYSVSFFGIGNVLTIPLAVTLKDRIGIKRMLTICMLLFSATTFLGGFATTYPLFIFLRFCQGAASGPIFILVAGLNGLIAKPEDKKRFLHHVLVIFILSPALAGAVGGAIAYLLHWKWIFYLTGLCIGYTTFLNMYECKNFFTPRISIIFDYIGYGLYIVMVLSISLFVILGQELDWFRSPLLFHLFVIFCCALPAFSFWTWNSKAPILELRALSSFPLSFTLFQLAILFSTYYGMSILIPLWLKLYVNYDPMWIATALGSTVLAALLLMIALYHTERRKRLHVIGISILVLIVSCIYTMNFNVEVNFGRIAFSRLIVGFGAALFLPPLFNFTIHSVEEKDVLKALTLFQFSRALASSLGAAIYTTLWDRRFVFYYKRLGAKLTKFSENTAEYFAQASQIGIVGEQSDLVLNNLLEKQARSLALNDCFYMMAWLLGILLVILVLGGYWKFNEFKKLPAT